MISDAEKLIKLTAGEAAGKLSEVRGRLNQRLARRKERMADLEATLRQQTLKVAHATDDYVHRNPWQSVGVAAGVAFLLGLLAGRR